jgi:hypothetical protein
MFELTFRFQSWTDDVPPSVVADVVSSLVEALAKANQHLMMHHPLPPLYSGHVAYDIEGEDELFDDAAMVSNRGSGDCEDLVAYRLAELRLQGVPCEPLVTWQRAIEPGIPYRFHVRIIYPNGSVEDPSAILGMHDMGVT